MSVKFKAVAWPSPPPPKSYKGEEKITVPNNALSLEDILERFVRQEPVAVGKHKQYGGDEDLDSELTVDREKILNRDIFERHEYLGMLRDLTTKYEQQESARRKAAEDAAVQKRVEELAMKKMAEQNSGSA